MESTNLLTDQDDLDYSHPHTDYMRINKKFFNNSSNTQEILKYPKSIDPFHTTRHLIVILIVLFLILILFVIGFLWCFRQGIISDENVFESIICAIYLINFLLMLLFSIISDSWTRFLRNSGFFWFPTVIEFIKRFVMFFWSTGIFLFSPALILVRYLCFDRRNLSGNSTINNCIVTKNFHYLNLYMTVQTVAVVIPLVWYLCVVVAFKKRRAWPDILHERLLEVSSILEECPFIQTSELRTDVNGSSIMKSYLQNKQPTNKDIMKLQAYVIKYLRNLNNDLSSKICQQNRNSQDASNMNYGSTFVSDIPERQFDQSPFSSIDSRPRHNNMA